MRRHWLNKLCLFYHFIFYIFSPLDIHWEHHVEMTPMKPEWLLFYFAGQSCNSHGQFDKKIWKYMRKLEPSWKNGPKMQLICNFLHLHGKCRFNKFNKAFFTVNMVFKKIYIGLLDGVLLCCHTSISSSVKLSLKLETTQWLKEECLPPSCI